MDVLLNPEAIDIVEIMKLLPHRYPFLLVDKLLSMDVGKEVVGLKNVTINEPFFQGHFPGQPIMPGVLILEGMAQVGGVMAFYDKREYIGEKVLFFAGIDKARFRKPVLPGDQIIYTLKVKKKRRSVTLMEGVAEVDGQVVAEAELLSSFS